MPRNQHSLIADEPLWTVRKAPPGCCKDANKYDSGFISLCIIKYLTLQILPI